MLILFSAITSDDFERGYRGFGRGNGFRPDEAAVVSGVVFRSGVTAARAEAARGLTASVRCLGMARMDGSRGKVGFKRTRKTEGSMRAGVEVTWFQGWEVGVVCGLGIRRRGKFCRLRSGQGRPWE